MLNFFIKKHTTSTFIDNGLLEKFENINIIESKEKSRQKVNSKTPFNLLLHDKLTPKSMFSIKSSPFREIKSNESYVEHVCISTQTSFVDSPEALEDSLTVNKPFSLSNIHQREIN